MLRVSLPVYNNSIIKQGVGQRKDKIIIYTMYITFKTEEKINMNRNLVERRDYSISIMELGQLEQSF